ncbi:hypothetical protein ACOSQ2_019835 [Xanthoceras sorbifolium]
MTTGEDVPNRDLILALMSGVGHEYDVVVVMISSQHRTMSLEDAQFLFLMHEQRIDQLNSTTQLNIVSASANFTANQPGNYDKKVVAILVQITEAMAEEEMCYKHFDQGFQGPNPSPQANYKNKLRNIPPLEAPSYLFFYSSLSVQLRLPCYISVPVTYV